MSLPTAAEQQMLQLINRLRANPAGEFGNLILSTSPISGADPDITSALTFYVGGATPGTGFPSCSR